MPPPCSLHTFAGMPLLHPSALATLSASIALLVMPAAAAALPQLEVRAGRPIVDGPKTAATMEVHSARGGYRGRVGIELRGSSSLRFRKKSYALETRRRDGEARNVGLLGMPIENDWVLLAAFRDRSHMRDALAYRTARRFGRWAPRTRFVELRLDGRYQGIYTLAERVKLDVARVDVAREGVTGGYLLELSTSSSKGGFVGPLTRRAYGYSDPEADDIDRDERAYIEAHVARAEAAVYRGGDWRALVDEPALVDYLLLQELFKNQDAFKRSTFIAKGTDARLEFGPIWDFDRSAGDTHRPAHAAHTGLITRLRPWAQPLHRDAGFMASVAARWRELRDDGLGERLLADVAANARVLGTATARDGRRWGRPRAAAEHRREVRRMRAWLTRRMAWLDSGLRR